MLGTFSPLIISIYYGLLILVIEYIVTPKIKMMIRINFKVFWYILFIIVIFIAIKNLSFKAPVCQWVSLCVWMFPNSSKTANPSELKFWGMIPLGIGKVLG